MIYFSDVFGVAPETLDQYGAFNIALVNDLPLFIDPFLLFDSAGMRSTGPCTMKSSSTWSS